ncbi:MAG: hypothetical protein GWP06_09555 [Actinobacteria bacterium]|nr:hypothetical protein [Actinomycetota bacterium]
MPISEIKPGMKGIGKTIFYGDKIEEFGVEVLDIVKNFYPQRDIVLVRLTGKEAEKTGVVSGMSGSPVYIDNKLVGALAYRFGQFMKEPIGGVMPIAEMIQVAKKESVRKIEAPMSASLLPQYLQAALCGAKDHFWSDIVSNMQYSENHTAGSLQMIQAPLVFAGFAPQTIRPYEAIFQSLGFTMVQGGSNSSESTSSQEPFMPGSAVSLVFISGDYGIEASGTVTAVDGNKMLAFGHYVFNLGPIQLPLARTKVLATLPSYMGSSKMVVSTGIVGSFRQDRLTGMMGDLSIKPVLIPVHLQLNSPVSGKKDFHLKMASDPALNNLLPFYLRIALIQALTSARLAGGMNSLSLETKINLADGRIVTADDFFSSKQRFGFFGTGMDAAAATDLIASTLGVLMVNYFSAPAIKNIEISATDVPGEKTAKIHSIWQDKTELSPGDSLILSFRLKTAENKDIKFIKTYHIPKNLDANSLAIFISSGASLTQYELRVNPDKFRPVDFDHLLKLLKERRKNNNIYIQFRLRDSGLIIDGEELSDLPPSIMKVMDSRRSSGVSKRLHDRVLFEDVIPTDYVISGARRLTVRIKKPKKASIPKSEEPKKSAQPVFW